MARTKREIQTRNTKDEGPRRWEPPAEDQEFEFTGPESIPSWGFKGWQSWDNGPALALPAGDLYGNGPSHHTIARIGDKVLFIAATPSKQAHFEVVRKEPDIEDGTILPAAQTNASLEDLIRGGTLGIDELGAEARGQVSLRTPRMRRMIETGEGAPKRNELPVFARSA